MEPVKMAEKHLENKSIRNNRTMKNELRTPSLPFPLIGWTNRLHPPQPPLAMRHPTPVCLFTTTNV